IEIRCTGNGTRRRRTQKTLYPKLIFKLRTGGGDIDAGWPKVRERGNGVVHVRRSDGNDVWNVVVGREHRHFVVVRFHRADVFVAGGRDEKYPGGVQIVEYVQKQV